MNDIRVIHTNLVSYLYNLIIGNLYHSQESVFNNLALFYQKRITSSDEIFTCEEEFVIEYCESHKVEMKNIFWFWPKEKKVSYMLWSKRLLFLYENNIGLLKSLLAIKYYLTTKERFWNLDVNKAYVYIELYTWLTNLQESDNYNELKISDWIIDIESRYAKGKAITKSFEESVDVKKEVKCLNKDELEIQVQIESTPQLIDCIKEREGIVTPNFDTSS